MLTDLRAIAIKSVLGHIVESALAAKDDREELALDLIEFIALRLRVRDDAHVFSLGLFVRTALAEFLSKRMVKAEFVDRLARAAMAAGQGPVAFLRAVHVRCDR